MAKERNGFITMKPEDFVKVTGAPYYPASIMGQEGSHLVPTNHWYVMIDGQPWMRFGFHIGRLSYICKKRDEFNAGIGVDKESEGARFAVGPSYDWCASDNGMRRMSGKDFAYAVWINKLPNYGAQEIVKVEEIQA